MSSFSWLSLAMDPDICFFFLQHTHQGKLKIIVKEILLRGYVPPEARKDKWKDA